MQLACRVDAAAAGESDVHESDIRGEGRGLSHSFGRRPNRGNHVVAELSDQHRQIHGYEDIVFDDQDTHLLAGGIEALADWAEDVEPMPKRRSIAQLCRDPEVSAALADGGALALVPLVRDAGRAVEANLSLDAGLLAAIDEAAAARG